MRLNGPVTPTIDLGTVRLFQSEALRITAGSSDGQTFCEVRLGVMAKDGPFVPRRPAVRIPLNRIPDLIQMLSAAVAEAPTDRRAA